MLRFHFISLLGLKHVEISFSNDIVPFKVQMSTEGWFIAWS